MLITVNSQNPDARKIKELVQILENGGVIIYPTDSVYALGCDINQPKAISKICQLRKLNPAKANLTLICKDIKQVSEFARQISNPVFRTIKQNTPGPFTFIIKSNNFLPKVFKNNKRTVGVRIPDNNIAMCLIEALGRPLLSISLKNDDEILDYFTDPYEIHEDFGKAVNAVVNGGFGGNTPSAVVECCSDEIDLIREGPEPLLV